MIQIYNVQGRERWRARRRRRRGRTSTVRRGRGKEKEERKDGVGEMKEGKKNKNIKGERQADRQQRKPGMNRASKQERQTARTNKKQFPGARYLLTLDPRPSSVLFALHSRRRLKGAQVGARPSNHVTCKIRRISLSRVA